MKDRVERSRGMQTLIPEALAKVKPTDPLRLAKQVTTGSSKASWVIGQVKFAGMRSSVSASMFLSTSQSQTAPVSCRAEPERDMASILKSILTPKWCRVSKKSKKK
jgi:hypothetical protein